MGREHSKFEFRYDQNDQLIQTRFQGMNGMPNLNQSHQYDFAGNRIRDSKNGVGEFLGNFLLRNEDSTFVADPDGRGETVEEITGDQKKVYSYRSDGKISGYQSGNLFVSYHYDAFDRLLGKSINKEGTPFTNTFVHLGSENRVLLGKAGNGEVTKYIDGQGVAERLGEVKGTSGNGYITDHLGSVLNSGVAGSSKSFGLWGEISGNIALSPSLSPVIYGFQAYSYDVATGQYETPSGRRLMPGLGRWNQQDPIGLDGGDENLYRSMANNPVRYTDSSGNAIDNIADVGFIGYDLYRIWQDNIAGNCDNLGENLAALGADIVGAAVPGGTGLGMISRAGSKASKVQKANRVETVGKFTKNIEVRPGKGPGQSRAEYVVIKNAKGEVVKTYKDSYDRANKFIHRKPLSGGPEGRK